MWPLLYTGLVFFGFYTAFRCPSCLNYIKVDANYSLAAACFFLGLGASTLRFKQLIGTQLGLRNIAFSFCIGTFLWPALGLTAAVLALRNSLPFAMVVGFAILAACPVGAPISSLHTHIAGGSLECSLLMSLIAAPFALITFPYAFRHFLLLLLDQPCPSPFSSGFSLVFTFFSNVVSSMSATSAEAAKSSEEIRNQLTASLDVPSSVFSGLWNQALFGVCLPLAAGVLLAAKLPSQRLAAKLRVRGPQLAALLVAYTAAIQTAGSAVAAGLAGGVKAVARSEAVVPRVVLEGEQQQQQLPQLEGVDVMLVVVALLVVVVMVGALHWVALLLGWLIPAGVGSPGWTCRTVAYQATMRNPLPGLALATALFGSSPAFPLVAAPCVASLTLQAALGAWTALLGWLRPPKQPAGPPGAVAGGGGAAGRASMVNSQRSILRQQTLSRSHRKEH
ncbi:hypothetical protein Agub_g5941 [Astrephomene gubernaculifera]|uniref:Uncharacterized protein n=1 Tax=Astrephomene gubernaculifera TaxID=47775 RepID=A0AAD3DML5_9CHLO|nr:hypothetical protein Agub_g5941 [Astrephomene gubernaculifera]